MWHHIDIHDLKLLKSLFLQFKGNFVNRYAKLMPLFGYTLTI